MSNTIKLKRGSGSDPSASDLVVGELAIRTDSGKLFTKKDNGNVSEISGGGISDGDKGDITVSNGGDSFLINSGIIDNANIASNAAIDVSKLSGVLPLAGGTLTGNLTLSSVTPQLYFTDTNHNPDYAIWNHNGVLRFLDTTNSNATRLEIQQGGLVVASNGFQVTGNIVVSGNVDGVDIATRDTLFGGLTSSSGVLSNGVTATTQSASDNSTKVATTAYTDTAIANLIDSSPSTLNTLNELASALGDDPNFATTVTNSIATKLPLAGGTLTGDVTYNDNVKAKFGTSSDFEIFHDGNHTNLLERGTGNLALMSNGGELQLAHNDNAGTFEHMVRCITNGAVELYHDGSDKFATNSLGAEVRGKLITGSTTNLITGNLASSTQLAVVSLSGNNNYVNQTILGGRTGRSTLNFGDQDNYYVGSIEYHHDTNSINFKTNGGTTSHLTIASNGAISVSGTVDGRDLATDGSKLDGIESNATADQTASEILTLLKTVDGSGSGLDADTIDGLGSGQFLRSDANDTATGAINFTSTGLQLSGHWYSRFYSGTQNYIHLYPGGHTGNASVTDIRAWNGTTFDLLRITGGSNNITWRNNTIWNSGNDGSGSGLDSDTVDGIQASSFLRSDAADTASGALTFSRELTFSNDDDGIFLYGGARFYKKSGSGVTIRLHDANTPLKIENNSGTFLGNVFHSGNDGSGSGLDADLLDGQEGSYYRNASNLNAGTVAAARLDTATTQSAGNSTTKIATTAFVSTAISNLINGAPSALDTLNELAAAMSDDAAFSTTVTNSLATKMPLAGGQFTGNITFSGSQTVDGRDLSVDGSKLDGIESGATADQTASEILTLIKTVDGAGSGLDADTLDGISSANFVRSDTSDTMAGNYNVTGQFLVGGNFTNNSYNSVSSTRLLFGGGNDPSNYHIGTNMENFGGNYSKLDLRWHTGIRMGAQAVYGGTRIFNNEDLTTVLFSVGKGDGNIRIESGELYHNTSGTSDVYWHESNDGSGSGLDSDLLDGVQGSSYLRSDTSDTFSGTLTNNSRNENPSVSNGAINLQPSASGGKTGIVFRSKVNSTSDHAYIWWYDDLDTYRINNSSENGVLLLGIQNDASNATSSDAIAIESSGDIFLNPGIGTGVRGSNSSNFSIGNLYVGNASTRYKVFHEGNDGAASGLDSDKLDGQEGSYYRNASNLNAGTLSDDRIPNHVKEIRTDDDITARMDSGFYETATATTAEGWPETSNSYYHLISSTHSNTANYYSMQIAGNFFNQSNFYIRSTSNSGTRAWSKIWTSSSDGSGSGLDADTVDGIQGASLLRSDTADTASGDITFSGGAGAVTIAANSDATFVTGSWTGNHTKIQHHSNRLYIVGGSAGIRFREAGSDRWDIDPSGHFVPTSDSTYNIGSNGTRVANGYFDTLYGDGSNLTGISAGATGGGSDEVFYENDQTVTTNYTITNGKNAMAAGPITINSGVTVTVGSGETLTIV